MILKFRKNLSIILARENTIQKKGIMNSEYKITYSHSPGVLQVCPFNAFCAFVTSCISFF